MAEPTFAIDLFATPVVVFDLPALADANREIAAVLLDEEQAVPSWQRANVGGWHSVPDLGRRPHAGFVTVIRTVVEHVSRFVGQLAIDRGMQPPTFRYGVTAWAMIMRGGHYVMPHDHGDVHWSVAYYVDAGDDIGPPSGRLAFLDPRRSGRTIPELELFPSTFEVTPRTGSLVIFPGWLQHYVHAYRGARPRICISCNLTMEPVAQDAGPGH